MGWNNFVRSYDDRIIPTCNIFEDILPNAHILSLSE